MVIIGGGIIGTSVAYHLTETRDIDVCLLERKSLTCGTTWHAAGLVGEVRASANLTRLARYTTELYEKLETTGNPIGYRRVGAVTLAATQGRAIELKRQAAMARNNSVDCRWLTTNDLADRWPHLYLGDIEGGIYMPRDGQTNPVDTTQALARLAKASGARVLENVEVLDIHTEHGRITRVATDQGEIRCNQVLLAAGLWSRDLALRAGARVPLYPSEHFYVVSEPIDIPDGSPIVRDPDHGIYLKPDAGRLLVGCFEKVAKPLDPKSLPVDFAFDELPFDLDHFTPYLEHAVKRIPALNDTGIRTWFNGPESFTPDGRYILGETPEIGGLFVAAGFNSIGIQSAGGVGRVMAQWIVQGHAPMDLWEVDVKRFLPFHNDPGFLVPRTAESLGLLYDMHWPYRQYASARGQRRSPIHDLLAANGACFGELAGWERANWYDLPGSEPRYQYSFERQNWFEASAGEHRAVRETAALFDQTSFAKYEVVGPDACRFLNRLSTANIDMPDGRVIYCQWLNERAGIEADITITRIAKDRYWVISAAPCQTRDLAWMARHRPGFDVEILDFTESVAVFSIMGPQARERLQRLTQADLSQSHFPFATSSIIEVAGAEVRATRLTYVGALGWELYVANRHARDVYRALVVAPIQHAGYHALDSLRIEKAYRHWGHDITDEDTPVEAGLSFTADWNKPDGFIGRDALERQKRQGVVKRLALFKLDDPDALLFRDEPIWRDGQPVGYLRSGAYGHTVGAALGFGYVTADEPLTGRSLLASQYAIEVAERRIPAQISLRALFDPSNATVDPKAHC
ncbi:MAG: FAD-dependent oxidoreductase [Gammaproteobacteria bacterium]|nr:FAD-dependent oxidoreductase [Gammaproteobacteria bacterium]